MAAQGGIALQEKVSRLLSRENGKPLLKPIKPLALKDIVTNRGLKKKEATCITEISILMACWKQNNFVDSLCSAETDAFYACVANARAAKKAGQGFIPGGRLPQKQAVVLLKRYPNHRYEI